MRAEWTRRPQAGTSAVFVHGILSSGEACWRHDNGSYWPELLTDAPELKSLGIYVFTYQTGIFSGSYRLSDIVDALKEHMRLDGVLESNRLIFVCHSMGGLVVRKLIVERATELIEAEKEIGLFLVASPSLGASYADWLSPLAQLFGHAQADALRFVRDNDWLKDLDKEFINLKEAGRLKIKGKELVEDKFVVLKRLWRRQVVEAFSGARYFGEPFKVPESDHFSIAKPKDKGAIQHRLLCQFIVSALQQSLPEAEDQIHAHALNLSASRTGDVFTLWVTNRGTHVIREIEINAIPDEEDWQEATHGSLPKMQPADVAGTNVIYPILGGWFIAKVAQLSPNRGLMVASYEVEHGDYTKMDFDAFWNDHDGMQRKAHAVVNVAAITGDFSLKSRQGGFGGK